MERVINGGKGKMNIFTIICLIIVGFLSGTIVMYKMVVQPTFAQVRKAREESSKHLDLYLLMNDWVHIKQDNISISKYFENKGYNQIAIYGMNYVGETLVSELKNSSIKIATGIDRNAPNISSSIPIVTMDQFKEKVDVIVVTPIAFFDSIADMLEEKVTCPIISIEDVIFEARES